MSGHIRRSGKHSWELKFDIGRDESSGKRITQFHSFKGTKKEAKLKLAELVASVGQGSYVTRSHLTVGEHVAARIGKWEALGKISPKTIERYRELLANQIIPHIGQKPLQKLKSADIEAWHAILKTVGRKDGQGGLSTLTIRHAHRLLSKALKEGMRHDLVARNVATAEQPPKAEGEEVVVLDVEQVKLLGRAVARSRNVPEGNHGVVYRLTPGRTVGASVASRRPRVGRQAHHRFRSDRGNQGWHQVQITEDRQRRSGRQLARHRC